MKSDAVIAASQRVGLALKMLRVSRRRTARSVAANIGLSESKYSRIEHGKVEPSLPETVAIVEELGSTFDAFVHDLEVPMQ